MTTPPWTLRVVSNVWGGNVLHDEITCKLKQVRQDANPRPPRFVTWWTSIVVTHSRYVVDVGEDL